MLNFAPIGPEVLSAANLARLLEIIWSRHTAYLNKDTDAIPVGDRVESMIIFQNDAAYMPSDMPN